MQLLVCLFTAAEHVPKAAASNASAVWSRGHAKKAPTPVAAAAAAVIKAALAADVVL